MADWATWISASSAVVAAIAAALSLWTARTSNRTARTLAAIETDRRHAELIPTFEVRTKRVNDDVILIYPKLVGPPSLDRIDRLTVIVRDDTVDHSSELAGSPTSEQLAATIWGPYRLTPMIDGASSDGRSVGPVRLLLGDDRPFQFESTRPPIWTDAQWWDSQYRHTPIRLAFRCETDGFEPWIVPTEVKPPAVRFHPPA
jgi:hypothetical protein